MDLSDRTWRHYETWKGHNRKGEPRDSHNHYAYGAVVNFLIERLVGIAPSEPGFGSIDIRPTLLPGINHAKAAVGTPFGPVSSGWEVDGDSLLARVTVPEGTTAHLQLGNVQESLEPGNHERRYPVASIKAAINSI